jgi:hypothetical protein
MTQMRWVISREQVAGSFSSPIDWPDGSTVYARLQHRESDLSGAAAWLDIPVVSEITEAPKIALVRPRGH